MRQGITATELALVMSLALQVGLAVMPQVPLPSLPLQLLDGINLGQIQPWACQKQGEANLLPMRN